MENVIDGFYNYLVNNNHENDAYEIIATLYDYVFEDGPKNDEILIDDALSLLYDDYYNSFGDDSFVFAFSREKRKQLVYEATKNIMAQTDENSNKSVIQAIDKIKELTSDLEEYDVVYIKGPDGETYASAVIEELGAFFESLESADESIKLYIECRD